jgi:ABC-type nitrate/sulfonate/bicarbonate transport system substrate-binding protein
MTIEALWYTRCPAPTAATIAIRNGWLEEEFARDGIVVRSLASSTDREVHLSHYRHTQPNSFRFGGYVPPLVSRGRGADLKAIGISWHDRVHGVFALPESGIRTPSGLKGKRLGVPVRLNDDVDWWKASVLGGYDALFASGAVARDEVELVEVPIARPYVADATAGTAAGKSLWGASSQFAVQREEVAALYRGAVDAVYSDGALTAILRATTGAHPVALIRGNEDDTEGYGTPCLLTVSGRLLADRPDLVTRWVERLLDAKLWAISNPETTKRWFAQETGLPEDLLEFAYSARLGAQADVSLAPNRLALVKAKYDHLVSLGFIDKPFDFDALFDPAPLTQALALWKSA